jgi:hypothetical protein
MRPLPSFRQEPRCLGRCRQGMIRNAAWIASALMLAVACGSTPSPPTSTRVFLGSLGRPGCAPPAAWNQGGTLETGMDSSRGSLWALSFSPIPPASSQVIKVVWRMTGTGSFEFRVSDSAGVPAPLAWGPDYHGSSTWHHPGDEVGTGLNFPHPGCWVIHVVRSNTSGDLWLEVAS